MLKNTSDHREEGENRQMKNFVNVDTRFQKSINLTLDTGDMALVNRYIPTRSSVSILKQYLTNIVRGQGEHATILIGPYGKGKSHLLLVLLALLCKSKDETAEIQKKIIEADTSTKLFFMELAEVGRPFLPVIVSSFQGDLNESFIFALQEALKKTGIRDLPLPSEYSEAVRTMESWKESYPDTYQRFEKMLEERGCTASLFKERLKKQKEAALLEFKEFYPLLTSGSVFNPMVQKEALRVYEEVNRVLCAKYGYAGIYIIFDEFSKYIEGHETKNFAKDMKILQDMCELADSRKEEQMYLTFVAHKSIHEYVKSIDSEMIQAFRGVEGRLKEIRFVVSSQNNYELIEHALHKKEGFYTPEIQERAEESYQLACFSHLFEKEDFNQIVAKGCYPLTPVCAYALLNISEKIGQNERTVFTFLAGNEPGSLNRIMEGRNRENLIGVEYVYDYFKNLFRETVDETYIHNEWLKAEYALTKADTEIEKRIIKAMAIIRMIRRPEELAVLNKPICLALNIEKEECDKAMRELMKKEVVFFRSSLGTYAFKNNIGINIEEAIEKEIRRLRHSINTCKVLNEISELTYAVPKQYNQDRAMTRYFRYEFIEYEDFLSIGSAKVFFEHRFSDGYILAIVTADKVEKEKVLRHLRELGDERIIVLLPKEEFVSEWALLRLAAVRSLAQDEHFIEENKALRQELDLYEEDIRYEVNERLKRDFMPENGGCYVLHTSRKEPHIRTGMEFNRYLSQICEDYYSLAPRINHELLNIQNVQGQYLKARNDVVRAILDGKDLEEYERGSSPQAMVYRAAFLRTGLAGEEFPLDGGCRKIMEEIEDFFVKASGKRASFQILYERLQGKDYGVRKGVLPLFLAWKFYLLEGMPVLYLGNKELLITVEVLNNINQFPESYDLYIEKKDMEKELYLQEMEKIFCDAQTEKIIRSNRLSVIMENMQKWYRSLPQYTRVSERYPQELLDAVRNFRRLLKQTELNPREFLFEQLPNAMNASKDRMTGCLVQEMKRSMDTHFENAIEDTAKEIKKIFGAKESDSLKACLQDWYGRQQNRSKRYVLNKKIKSFMEYVGELNTNDEREIVAVLSKRLEDIYIEDWNDRLQEKFLRDITKIRQKTEAAKEDAGLENGQKEIFLKTADGAEIHKYYDADVKDSTSEFLKNMIEEALDNFGDSLETNQKVAVLAEALEKLLQ